MDPLQDLRSCQGANDTGTWVPGFKLRQWCTSRACSTWIRHQGTGIHGAFCDSAGNLRRCPESRSEQSGPCVGKASKKQKGLQRLGSELLGNRTRLGRL